MLNQRNTLTQAYCPQPEPHVAIAVVDLLQELTDIDTLHESEEGAEVLIDALVSTSVFDYSDGAAFCGVWALKQAEKID